MGPRIQSPQTAPVVAAHITVLISASSSSIPTLTSPDDESRYRLNRKSRIDGTPLKKPIELLKKSEKPKGKKGTEAPLDDDAPTTHLVATAEAAADVNTMYRDCVITTHASNCRVLNVLFDTGSTP